MSTKWAIYALSVWVFLSFIAAICDQAYFGGGGEITVLQSFMQPHIVTVNVPVVGEIVAGISTIVSYIVSFLEILVWHYAFFTGPWKVVEYAILWPIGIGITIATVFSFVRGVPTGS